MPVCCFLWQIYILNVNLLQQATYLLVEKFVGIVKTQHKKVTEIGLTPVSTASCEIYIGCVIQYVYVPR